ncbi:MAG: hypothetical protein KF860_10405 [Cyclobacteriaceae bacterium]|nr:hypothetical protein [Cyclobacteriaceae bacterium]
MKKSNTTVTAVVFTLAAFLMFSSFKVTKNIKQLSEPIQPGFYMNDGCTKVDSINCYGYSGFCFVHKITPEMLVYDKISYYVYIASDDVGKEKESVETIDGSVFKAVVGQESMIKIPIGGNLKYTTRKEMVDNAYLAIEIIGSMISGYQESWNASNNSVEKTPIYKNKTIRFDKIPLSNRAFYKRSFFSSFSSKGMDKSNAAIPIEPKSPDCYSCITEKPKIFELNPSDY